MSVLPQTHLRSNWRFVSIVFRFIFREIQQLQSTSSNSPITRISINYSLKISRDMYKDDVYILMLKISFYVMSLIK